MSKKKVVVAAPMSFTGSLGACQDPNNEIWLGITVVFGPQFLCQKEKAESQLRSSNHSESRGT